MRNQKTGELRDVLLTDAPGEWFTQWARSPGGATAAGARWVVEHSDVLLVLIDSAALADSEKLPQTRRATRDLIERVGAEERIRPLIVVWTKDDVEIPKITRDAVNRACDEFVPTAVQLKTTVTLPSLSRHALLARSAKLRLKSRLSRLSRLGCRTTRFWRLGGHVNA